MCTGLVSTAAAFLVTIFYLLISLYSDVLRLILRLASDHYLFHESFLSGRTGRVGNLGKATSFVDTEGDGDVMPKLVDMLTKVFVWSLKL